MTKKNIGRFCFLIIVCIGIYFINPFNYYEEKVDESLTMKGEIDSGENSITVKEESLELKEEIEEKGNVGELIMDGVVAKSEEIDINNLKPGVNWSSKELSAGDYEIMKIVAGKLYENHLNRKGESGDFLVEVLETTPEIMEELETDVLYQVDDQGILTLFLNLKIFDLINANQKEEAISISLRYKNDVVEMVEEE